VRCAAANCSHCAAVIGPVIWARPASAARVVIWVSAPHLGIRHPPGRELRGDTTTGVEMLRCRRADDRAVIEAAAPRVGWVARWPVHDAGPRFRGHVVLRRVIVRAVLRDGVLGGPDQDRT
jgi:hypothetical protein